MEPIIGSIVASALDERLNDVENRGVGDTGGDYDDSPEKESEGLGFVNKFFRAQFKHCRITFEMLITTFMRL
jgi:hypothetical protein